MIIISINRENPIHKGERTHTQDHLIIPINFNPINRTVRAPPNPIPSLDAEDDIFSPFGYVWGRASRLIASN